ncbi:Pkinase domain-containing [Pyrrhoderma noxium]|uniref:Pkinase domain-containing n=1 Tax=Pyrrhoderma noxium TaxID=2282107 RepID=A0A286UA23_9AGAM|nr:Pkinase domain-containing [Pyrrhoderma noxium]
MGDKVDTKDQFLDNPQDGQKKLSHSSLRPQDNLADGSLEPVSSSQLHPHSESGTLLGRQRDRIIKDLGSSVSRGSLEYFKKILPPIRPEFDINKISSHLIKNGDLVQEEGIYVWNEFRSATIVTTEMQSFNRTLVNVLNAICDAALETSGIRVAPTVDMVTDEDNGSWSVNGSSATLYGYLKLKEGEERVKRRGEAEAEEKDLWYNIAVSLTLKTVDDSENVRNAIRNMRRVLAVDPSRRFTYGIDIEGTELGLWIATRAMVIACDTFDFRTRYNDLIWIFLSLSFASKEDLGWDMSIKSTLDAANHERLYDIEVGGEHYHTSESNMISGEKADDLVTSATRIWKAKRASDGADIIVKDFWPSDGRETEDNIRKTILENIKGSKKRKFFKRHTLNPISAGRVKCNGKDDHTKDTILRGHSPDTTESHKIPIPSRRSSRKSKGSESINRGVAAEMEDDTQPLSRELERNQRTKYYHRYHYRIAYKEVAAPYDELRKTNAMIKVIIDAVKTLLYIHEAGWVHRDISVGNLYLYTDPVTRKKRGLIGDLEHAKRVGEGGKPDVVTGTPGFMAIEVASQSCLFPEFKRLTRGAREEGSYSNEDDASEDDDNEDGNSEDGNSEDTDGEDDNNDDSEEDDSDDDSESDDSENDDLEDSDEIGIYHNYIHDLESLWWILVWTVFIYKTTRRTDKTLEKRVKIQQRRYNNLFSGNMGFRSRSLYLRDYRVFERYMENVPPSLKDTLV